ncbi:MAG: ATP-grasp domain-containing protein [Alphaproteobacteria bacterium]|nr:ATP-grasp domain-containing protein [Alphaproteobacteria bacterium]
MKVLVTGAGALLGQGILRSLLDSPLRPTLIAVDPSPLAAGLYWTDHRYLIPMATDPTYLERVEALIAKERPDAVMVGTDVELFLFARERARLEATYRTQVVVSDERVVAIADDKYLTYEFLKEAGFDYPDSALPGGEEALLERVGFPLIVKPRVGARSIGVSKVTTRDELARAIAGVHEPVIQECVASDREEYTAGALCFDGVCAGTIVMRRDLRDGNTYRAYVEDYPELNAQVRRLAEALRPHGPANFQFRLDGDRVKVFEINGRFSGTTVLRARAGWNEVELVLRKLVLGEDIVVPEPKRMTLLRYWTEEVVPSDATVERA